MALKFNVIHSEWIADGERFPAGENTVDSPSDQLIRLAGSAHAAGDISVSEGLDVSHVESNEASEAKLLSAMGQWVQPDYLPDGTRPAGYWNGPWAEGHYTAATESAATTTIDIEEAE